MADSSSIGQKIRLCIVLGGHWDAQTGGAQYQAKCLAEAIAARQEFEIFYLANAVPRELEQEGYRIIPVGSGHAARLRLLPHLPSLYSALRTLRPHVVYQRCLNPYTGGCALYCRSSGAKLLFHAALDDDVRRSGQRGFGLDALLRRLERRAGEYGLRRADAIVVQTQDQARLLLRDFGLKAALVAPNFHPLPTNRPGVAGRKRFRIVWTANFTPLKNPEAFVDLAERLAHRDDIEFVMIGNPGRMKLYAELHQRIARLQNLAYLGAQPIERVNEEIADADLFVNTSSTEGFPNTFIQAWLRGVPVLSSFVDPDQCFSKGGAGILAGGHERLPGIVAELAENRSRLAEIGTVARDYGRENHGPARAGALIDLLAELGRSVQNRRQSRDGKPQRS